MPPRIACSSARSNAGQALRQAHRAARSPAPAACVALSHTIAQFRRYATAVPSPVASVPIAGVKLPDSFVPPTQPPSARPAQTRKSQMLRTYTSLLRSTPLILFFQHNNITANEWTALRRELRASLAAVPPPVAGPDGRVPVNVADHVDIQVLRTRMFDVAFKIVEFFDAEKHASESNAYTHDLSTSAYEAVQKADVKDASSAYAQIAPLFSGPVAAVTFPAVSPAHLAAVLKVLAPSTPDFPAPTRKKNPGYYDPVAQSALQKLLLIGGRVESKVFDSAGVKWVGGIDGGLDTLRAQLVHMLQTAGMGLTTALEGHSKGLWLTLESRRTQMDEEANGSKTEADETKKEA
ncbi:large subunit ribosomal protein L10 [Microdochium nivale]|nr:large subunit ribosomal protein L10 [Microdochium nivale]